jgi:perosamine synthetase
MKDKFIPVCEPALLGNELKYVNDAVSTGWISSAGKYVEAFERSFAEYCGVRYAVGVCNGTVALHLALTCLDIGRGDEVIVPNFTMIASAFSVCYTGATPVFVDADKNTWNIDVEQIESKITKKTKAIMPVHIFGLPCHMAGIEKIAKDHGLFIVEDAAESHGAEYNGKKTGSFSDIASFSFFANKNVTTGEGGMVVMKKEELYDKALYYKNLCFPTKNPQRLYKHDHIGFNYRMSNLHAAVGLAQVEKADVYRQMRIRNGRLYRELLADTKGIRFQKEDDNLLNVYWMNGLCVDSTQYGRTRDELIAYLKSNGVDTRVFFTGMNRQKSLQKYGCACEGDYPVTEDLSKNGFYLPSASTLSEDDIKYVCDLIINFRDRGKK